jgi:hypothetical protein
MIILDWLDENLDFEGVGVAAAMLGVVVSIVLCFIFGG